jgi:hypothetical protein
VSLAVGDTIEFVARVVAIPGGASPGDIGGGLGETAIEKVTGWATLTWATMGEPMTSWHEISALAVPNFKEVHVAVNVPARVAMREPFEAEIAITNSSATARDLSLIVDPADNTTGVMCRDDEASAFGGPASASTITLGLPGGDGNGETVRAFNRDAGARSVPPLQCLHKRVDVGVVPAMGTATVRVPLVALARGVFSLSPIIIVDKTPSPGGPLPSPSPGASGTTTFIVRERCHVYCTD